MGERIFAYWWCFSNLKTLANTSWYGGPYPRFEKVLASKQKLAAKAGPPEQVGIDYDDDPFLLGQKTVFYGQTVGFRKASFLCKQKSEEDIRPSTTSSDLVD